jgi:hypothetical protein
VSANRHAQPQQKWQSWHVFLNDVIKLINMKKAFFSILAVLFSTMVTLAQDGGGAKDVNINVNSKDSAWYASPWVWVVGAAVFILLLVALTRGGRRSD